MNYRMIFNMIGKVLKAEALLILLPAIVSALYLEQSFFAFAITAVLTFGVGFLLTKLCKPKDQLFFAKEGLITVALVWIFASLFGALPFMISGEIPSFVDAMFETVSGLTTTGASIVTNVENLSHGINFWRCFCHWIGGMGIIVFVMAITERAPDRSMFILKAEMPGPIVGKLVPRARDTAIILYVIYLVLTIVMMIFLLCGGMPLFDSACTALGTAGTGGFGIKVDSAGSYSSYSLWVIGIFMMIFGINFNLYYLILVGKIKSVLKSTELWAYVGIILASTAIISFNVYGIYGNLPETVKQAFFQVSSVITTTGYSSTDFDLWPGLSKCVLLLLMFIGGCAGSTAGGFKVSRLVIVCKKTVNDLKEVLHPRTKTVLKFEGKRLDEETIKGVSSYGLVYILVFAVIFFLLCFDSNVPDATAIESNFSAAAACFNNVGPAFAFAGPLRSYAEYSAFSKIVLTLAMLLGRLEIYPVLLTLIPTTWIKK